MRLVMVVPTYWSRHSLDGWREGDLVFDHPTPLDGEGTLGRFLRSLRVLDNRDIDLVLVVVPTSNDLLGAAVDRIRIITEEAGPPASVYLLSPKHLENIKNSLSSEAVKIAPLLSLAGYPHVRNGCLLAARLLRADIAVLIDDDEVFDDPGFLNKVREGFEKTVDGKIVQALAGYYKNPDGGYLINREVPEWGVSWPKYRVMDEAFQRFIGKPPRY